MDRPVDRLYFPITDPYILLISGLISIPISDRCIPSIEIINVFVCNVYNAFKSQQGLSERGPKPICASIKKQKEKNFNTITGARWS